MDLLRRKAQNYKVSNENYRFCTGRDFNKTSCGISTYHKWMFKLEISSIFHFDWASDGRMASRLFLTFLNFFCPLDLFGLFGHVLKLRNIWMVPKTGGTSCWGGLGITSWISGSKQFICISGIVMLTQNFWGGWGAF